MKTKTIELYEFDELPDKIKSKVLERERWINVDWCTRWDEFLLDEWRERLESMGFNNPEIAYSGFASQGDGASFTCESVDILKFCESDKCKTFFKRIIKASKSDQIEARFSVERTDRHYSHENTVGARSELLYYRDQEPGDYAELEKLEGILRDRIQDKVRKLSRQIYGQLENEYFGLTSDEAVIETIKANEYTFTESGRMEN